MTDSHSDRPESTSADWRGKRVEQALLALADEQLRGYEAMQQAAIIARYPARSARLAAYQHQNRALREYFGPLAEAPLSPAVLATLRRRPRVRARRWAEAAVLLLTLGLGGGWWLLGDPERPVGAPHAARAVADPAAAVPGVAATTPVHPPGAAGGGPAGIPAPGIQEAIAVQALPEEVPPGGGRSTPLPAPLPATGSPAGEGAVPEVGPLSPVQDPGGAQPAIAG